MPDETLRDIIGGDPDHLGYERFPIMYSNSGQFLAGKDTSGAVGATAKATVKLNNYPHEITGIRCHNVYEIPVEIRTLDNIFYCDRIDEYQDIETQLTQANVIINPTSQTNAVGKAGVHWHPFEVPYPFRAGNNLSATAVRTVAYPTEITEITWKVTWVGWIFLRGASPPPGPPSTGMS